MYLDKPEVIEVEVLHHTKRKRAPPTQQPETTNEITTPKRICKYTVDNFKVLVCLVQTMSRPK